MDVIFEYLGNFSRSDRIAIFGIFISIIIAFLLYKFGKKISFQQKLIRQHEIQVQLNSYVDSDIEMYNTRLYHKRYFYENKKDAFRGYCYLGAGIRGYGIDGVELGYRRESWSEDFNVEVAGLLPYEWIEYIKENGDGSTNKTIIFVNAPWLKFPYQKTVYYRYGRNGTDKISDKYRRITKPFKLRVMHNTQGIYRRLRYHFYLKWRTR